MKAIYHIKASLMALAAMVACTEMEINNESQDSTNNGLLQELSITGKDFQFEDATRSSVTIGESGASFTWDEDDVIGIFPDKGDQVSFAMDKGAGTQTATFSGGGWALKSSSRYAAYYPHVYENRDLTKIPVSYVGQTQNGNANTDHIGAYDFMAASVTTPSNGAVAFDMQHLGALVQLTITVPKPTTLTKITLNSTFNLTETGNIDLSEKEPNITATTQSKYIDINLANITTTKPDEEVIIYFMMAPIDLSNYSSTITFYDIEGNNYNCSLPAKNIEKGRIIGLAGEPLDYNFMVETVSLNKTSISLYEGESITLKAYIYPTNAKNKNLTWESKDKSIAVVENGVVTAISTGKTIIKATTVDGSNKSTECEVYVRAPSDGTANGHEYVDLGVRDSNGKPIYWATKNIGASSETSYGSYFAWGETTTKYQYTYASNKWYDTKYTDGFGYTKYQKEDKDKWSENYWNSIDVAWYDSNDNFIGDGLTSLQAEDDAATINWGEGWRTPTQEDFQALIDNCNFSYEFPLIKISNKNDDTKFIYLPLAGYKKDYSGGSASQTGDFAMYWTSTLWNATPYAIQFSATDNLTGVNTYIRNRDRYLGQPIRPVFVPSN